jgi:hypothetical protein
MQGYPSVMPAVEFALAQLATSLCKKALSRFPMAQTLKSTCLKKHPDFNLTAGSLAKLFQMEVAT